MAVFCFVLFFPTFAYLLSEMAEVIQCEPGLKHENRHLRVWEHDSQSDKTEKKRLCIQAAEIGFLHRVLGLLERG